MAELLYNQKVRIWREPSNLLSLGLARKTEGPGFAGGPKIEKERLRCQASSIKGENRKKTKITSWTRGACACTTKMSKNVVLRK